LDALRSATGESASQVRRWIEQKGLQLVDIETQTYVPQEDPWLRLPAQDLQGQVVKVGKRNYYRFI